ncbi:MAG: radical SAM protein [Elusimicrobiota bacterium]|nr:radical SAM protein [Elusimicrobiota bacterium]
MKVLLINSPARKRLVIRDMAGGLGFDGSSLVILPPLELAYIAATLLSKNHQSKIIDSTAENYDNNKVYQIVKEYNPDVIFVTVSLPTIYDDCAFLKDLRNYSSARIIAKTGITYPPILKEILEKSLADMCIYGECELNIEEIILDKDKKGTAYLENNELKIEQNNVIDNLDDLPLPARNLLPNEKYRYVLLGDKITTMQTSRGCPFQCSYYCPYPLVQGKKWRARSPGNVLREIEDIVGNYQIKKILFRDATFTLDRKRAEQICNLIIEKKLKIDWWCETRVDCLDVELMRKMKEAGCKGMNIGVETGDVVVLETQAKIGLSLEKLKTIIRTAKELGLKLYFLLMIGLPAETKKSFYETYRMVRRLRPDDLGICFVTPYPGTLLYSEAKQKGWLETEDWTRFGGHSPLMHTDNFSTKDLIKAREMIRRGFLLSRKGVIGQIMSALLENSFRRWSMKSE